MPLEPFSVFSSQKLITSKFTYSPMNTTTILAVSAILAGAAILSVSGLNVIGFVLAQTTSDNATMSGNMTAGNTTGGNMTETSGSISNTDEFGNTIPDNP